MHPNRHPNLKMIRGKEEQCHWQPILTTESVVFEKKEKDEKAADPMMGMGGMM